MARYSRTLTAEAQAVFVAALRSGGTIRSAAAAAGVQPSSLYCRRARDRDFASRWDAAAAEADQAALERKRKDAAALTALRAAAGPPRKRPVRFTAWRQELFLTMLAATCDTCRAAAAAGVHRATVYRHITRDPAFARANKAALSEGYARMEQWLAAERLAREDGWRRWLVDGPSPAPGTWPTQDFDEQMALLRRYQRPDGTIAMRFVRHGGLKRWSFERAIALLAKKLRGIGIEPNGGDESGGP